MAETVTRTDATHEVDWLVIGSGFGGSVAALRLAEKGYSVAVVEQGRRFADDQFADSAWNLRRYLWKPAFGMRGILRREGRGQNDEQRHREGGSRFPPDARACPATRGLGGEHPVHGDSFR